MFKSKSRSEQVREQMRGHAKDLADKLAPHVETARDKAGPVIADARMKAAPVIAEARGKAAPVIADTRDKWNKEILPTVTGAVVAASGASEPYREEVRKRGRATAAALRGDVAVPEEKHRLRKFLGLLGLAGIAVLVAKALSDRQATTAWQSAYQPAPTPSPTTAEAAAGVGAAGTTGGKHVDDEAASSPDEALADAAELPHPATDPDHPVEEVHLKKD